MSDSKRKCPVCGQVAKILGTGQTKTIKCSLCGEYKATESFIASENADMDPHFVMCALRCLSDRGRPVNVSTYTTMQELQNAVVPPANPIETIDWILEYLARKTKGVPSQKVVIVCSTDYPLFFAHSGSDLDYHIRNAEELKFIEGLCGTPMTKVNGKEVYGAERWPLNLTFKGWSRIEELKKTRRDSKQAFVAMWFDDSLQEAWDQGFKPALEHVGLSPVRIDLKEHNNKICDEIIAEIRKSGLLIADFTDHRGGVYFEAGFAMGLGIQVIWTCRKDHIDKAHFDTRQYNHIVWETPEELSKKLVNRIEATLTL